MVKVSGGARDVGGAQAHFRYIDRHGKLPVETDEGQLLDGRSVAVIWSPIGTWTCAEASNGVGTEPLATHAPS